MAQNSNIARVDQDMELPKWCQASTEASLQRFTRGHGSMVNLLNLLSDHASMEKKVGQLYEEFETKWKKRALIEIGGTIADDEVNVVLKIWMATFKEKQDQHIQLLSSLHATDGPIRSLQSYINSEEAKATREATLSLFERAKQKQAMLEKDIKQVKGNFFLAKDKEVNFKLELDAAQDDHARYGALVTRWKQLQADGERASTSYRQKLQQEKSTRTTFIEEMKRFQDDSNAHERARLQQLQHVMTSVIQISKAVEIHRGERLGPLFEDGISRLEKYDFEREIALFNQLNVYQHEFPVEQLHPSEVLAKKETEEKSHLDLAPSPTAKAGPSVELAKKKTEKKSHLDAAPSPATKAGTSVQFAKKEAEEKSHLDVAPSPAAKAGPSEELAKKETEKKSHFDAAPSPAAKTGPSVQFAKKETEEKSHFDAAPSPAAKAGLSVQFAKKETEKKSHFDAAPSPAAKAGPSVQFAKKETEKKSHFDAAPSPAAKAVPPVELAKKKSHFDAAPSPAAKAGPSVELAKKKSYLDAAPSPAAKANPSVKLAKKKTEEKFHIDTAPSPATKAVPSVKLANKKSHLDVAPSPAAKAVPPVELAKKKSHLDVAPSPAAKAVPPVELAKKKSHLDVAPSPAAKAVPPVELAKKKSHLDAAPSPAAKAGPSVKLAKKETEKKSHIDTAPSPAAKAGPSVKLAKKETEKKSHLDAAPSPAAKAGPSVKLAKKETEKKSHLDVAPSLAAEAGPSDIQVLPVTKETAVPVRPILKSAGPRTRQRSRHVRYAVPRPSDFRTIPARPGPYNPVRRRSHTVKPIVENTGSIAYFDDLLKPVVTTAVGITHIAQGQTVKVYAVKDIFGVSVNDITCKAGCKIYMTRPASSGSAFGYIKKGWVFKRKIYGYFNEQLVTIHKKPGTDQTSNLMC